MIHFENKVSITKKSIEDEQTLKNVSYSHADALWNFK